MYEMTVIYGKILIFTLKRILKEVSCHIINRIEHLFSCKSPYLINDQGPELQCLLKVKQGLS